jgi:hypothetical protein
VARRTWSNDTPYNVLGRHLKRLGIGLLVGGIYDTVLGLWGLFWPESLAALLGIDLPPERFYFYLWPLLHAVFACFGFMAWMDVKRNIAIVTAAMVGRVVYALFMFAAVWRLDISWGHQPRPRHDARRVPAQERLYLLGSAKPSREPARH